jgi:hypothetical protein
MPQPPPAGRSRRACENEDTVTTIRTRLIASALAALTLVPTLAASQPAAAAGPSAVCALTTTDRIVAVGDVHGAYDRFVGILRAAGIVDGRARWIGGRATLVQTGDVVDRGPHSRRVLDLLMRLEREAARAGGAVHALLGNHEVMRMIGQWQDVSPGELAAFRTPESSDVREAVYDALSVEAARQARANKQPFDERAYRDRFMREVPLGFVEMRQAFGPDGDYGRWLRQRPAMVRINGILFVHGGVDPATAGLGCEAINAEVAREVAGDRPPSAAELPERLTTRELGPLWFRGLAVAPDPEALPDVIATLDALKARAMVVGHSPVNGSRITSRFGGRVVLLDTGMLGGRSYPGGLPSALEIHGETLTAIYADTREPLPPVAAGPS